MKTILVIGQNAKFKAIADVEAAEKALFENKLAPVLENLVARQKEQSDEVLVVEGVPLNNPADWELNRQIAISLDADVVLNEKSAYAEFLFGKRLLAEMPDLDEYAKRPRKSNLSPAAFRNEIFNCAIAANKTIVLPEGDEPRTVVAASICAERGLKTILLGRRSDIEAVAAEKGVSLAKVQILEPEYEREKYVARLVELRKSKGMTEEQARQQLEDNVVLGTMMLEMGVVDGLVSGAVHTTANTIRPALQLIKTIPTASTVSSVFFMCLDEQVLVYGDCAIVPNPNADELAQIAIQANDGAKAFGIEPRVAMLSYSTINSGSGADVDLVKQATAKVKELRPDILVEGPLQYDAAADETVAALKAPNNPVAGQANIFIFPSLSAGNIGYKAVQRNANALAMGPVLQGIRKPVNDLSRGALIEDIVYTIAITSVQAAN